MKTALIAALALLAACGNYDNDDIAFLEAIPGSSQLSLQVPGQSSSALSSGDAPLHSLTVGSAQNTNQTVGFILGLLDLIRSQSPNQRTASSRTWGPFSDTKNPGYQVQVEITRVSSSFEYAFSERKGASGSFTPIITGEFFTQSAHQGHGTLDFDNEGLFQLGIDGGSPGLSAIDVVYANDTTPRTLQTELVGAGPGDGGGNVITFDYQQQPDMSGKLVFDAVADFAHDGRFEDLHLIAVWQGDGAGRCDGQMSGGTLDLLDGGFDLVDHLDECWSAQFTETYFDSDFERPDGGYLSEGLDCRTATYPACPAGDPGSCVLPPGSP